MGKSSQTIKDFYGKVIGYIDTDSQGNKTIYDFYRRILGYYDKRRDVTQDFYRRVIARGDVSGSLIKYD